MFLDVKLLVVVEDSTAMCVKSLPNECNVGIFYWTTTSKQQSHDKQDANHMHVCSAVQCGAHKCISTQSEDFIFSVLQHNTTVYMITKQCHHSMRQ